MHLPDFNERQRLVLDAVIENGSVTRRQVQDLIKLSQTSSATLLKDLVQIGALEQEGDGPRTRYVIAPEWQELLNKAKEN